MSQKVQVTRLATRGRKKSEPRPARDSGSPYLVAKRAIIARGADPFLSQYPLGILKAHGIIDNRCHNAGCQYAFLYGKATNIKPSISAQAYEMVADGIDVTIILDDEVLERVRREYLDARAAILLRFGYRGLSALENVSVFEIVPDFMFRANPGEAREASYLDDVLGVLADHLRIPVDT